MHGVDVTHSRFFDQPKVKEAVAFAAEAHKGQARKTKEPYVTHCIETACIVEEVLDLAEDSEYSSRYTIHLVVLCIMLEPHVLLHFVQVGVQGGRVLSVTDKPCIQPQSQASAAM